MSIARRAGKVHSFASGRIDVAGNSQSERSFSSPAGDGMRALVWFRSDLRISDNPALHHACRSADEGVIAVFALCPQQWSDHSWGPMKVDFVLRNLRALHRSLSEINIPLMLVESPRFAAVPGKLLDIARRCKCSGLFFNREYEVDERRRDEEVRKLFEKAGSSVYAFTDQTILDVAAMRTTSDGWYTVFTPFKRKWLETVRDDGPLPICPRPRKQRPTGMRPDPLPGSVRGFAGPVRPDLWPEGEQAAQKRLRLFVSRRIEDYYVKRDRPAETRTSALSPYLACGVLSARQCLAAAMETNDGRLDT